MRASRTAADLAFSRASLGNKTKTALAAAIAQHSRFLILDEPTTGLDPVVLDELIRLLVEDCTADGRTVLLSTHQLAEIEKVADYIGILDRGKLLIEGCLDDIRSCFRRLTVTGADPKQAKPKDNDQYNFTDPESRIMKGADGFVQGYNAQAAVEADTQLIVGQSVTAAANDKEQLVPMLDVVEQQSGQRPAEVLADSGYCSESSEKNGRSMVSTGNPARGVRSQKEQPEPIV